MLCLGTPATIEDTTWLRTGFTFALIMQLVLTWCFYARWFFSKEASLSSARPQFLLSTVGWFLLSALGNACRLKQDLGIDLPSMLWGAGGWAYLLAVFSIAQNLHNFP